MKKFIVPAVVLVAMTFSSCGMSICDCVAAQEEMRKEMKDADDKEARDAVKEKYEGKKDQCKKLAEGMEKDKLKEEMEKCK